jgi:hypothetical protein
MKRFVASCFVSRSSVDNKKPKYGALVPPPKARERPGSKSACGRRVLPTCTHQPFLASCLHSGSRCGEGTQMIRCMLLVSSAHKRVTQEGGTTTGGTWTGDGKRWQVGPDELFTSSLPERSSRPSSALVLSAPHSSEAWCVRQEAESRCGEEPSRLAAQASQRHVHLAVDGKALRGTGK